MKLYEKTIRLLKLTVLLAVLSIIIVLSYYIAVSVDGTDFPVFYTTAERMLNPDLDITTIYMEGHNVYPERYPAGNYFIYSPVIALAFAPLALLDYYDAKFTVILLNVLAYLLSIFIVLRRIDRFDWVSFIIATVLTWMPFVTNFCGAQINGILLLLIVFALEMLYQNKPIFAGVLLGLAALFKIFPLFIAFFLLSVNRKITISCFSVFTLALLSKGSQQWFDTLPTVSSGYTPAYSLIKSDMLIWYIVYAVAIIIISFSCIYFSRAVGLLNLYCYSITSAFMLMPIVQYHHLIMLTIVYIAVFYYNCYNHKLKLLYIAMIVTIVHINLHAYYDLLPNTFWSISLIWLFLSYAFFRYPEIISHAKS